MRIAIIGSGISGLASAWLLGREHEVVLFEANDYLGGHTHTHDIELDGRHYRVDSGFIVHNPAHYPLLHGLFDELGVASQPTTMSFSVRNEATGLEYNATTLDTLFCQRRNLLSPRFIGMVRDLMRFYREAPSVLDLADAGPSLGDYLARHGYGAAFRDEHLVPMASALWSSPPESILKFPVQYLVRFMANHQMLQVNDRPQWQVVRGGSRTYIEAMRTRWRVTERLSSPVRSVRRDADGVALVSSHGTERFDQVIFACHSDQALSLLDDASNAERTVLGAIPYQVNDTVLHTDASVLPSHRKAWAAWNALLPAAPGEACTVSYYMNLLQRIESPRPFIVSLNQTGRIDPARILRRMTYAHPVYTAATVRAQSRKGDIQGVNRYWFAGAYWGWGFHEDGMRSAMDVVNGIRRVCARNTA
ncbi:NAD(P)/FAD-dependent oxidoreductase [Luteibacter sahnii]|uniref:NAD(P)/FAD-dependent oxidoreductase n=1 Tax=Luteibacter sahnii TaxID=3021977 RepID=UPI002A6AE740|nr:FAD-dependent oxidoreductase [Luteibacter sp. PPL193]MDY1547551.1 FAD-dependent oxidoreductase [Luteibacter sp. PPL193]